MLKLLLFTAGILMSIASTAAPKLTIYDDGLSCPNQCDSHVVFHPSLNGTKFAQHPDSTPAKPRGCLRDSDCRICFDDKAKECLVVPYRGNGPSKNTFDLTPAFYSLWCVKSAIPTRLRSQCESLMERSKRLFGRINCIVNPDHAKCQVMMQAAVKDKQKDTEKYQQCRIEGQATYNASRHDKDKRAHNCTYSYLSIGGPNSRGVVWKKLLAGACRDNTYVGRDGLDCCSGNIFVDAALHHECEGFYPKQ